MPFHLHKKNVAKHIEYNFKTQGNNLRTPLRTLLKISGGTNTLNPTNIQGSNFLPPPRVLFPGPLCKNLPCSTYICSPY